MAKKVSNNKITDVSQDWGLDMSNGLPYSGQSVQDFIKEGIVTANTAYSEKWGAVHFDPNTYTLMGFKNEQDKEEWLGGGSDSLVIGREVFNFSGTMNQIKVINKMSSANLYFATTEQSAPITVGFLSQQKGITDTDWTDVLEDFYVTVTIDKGVTGSYTPIETEKLVLNGADYTIDIRKHLASGNNRIRITVTGALTNTTSNFIFTVYLTSMYLSPSNFTWYKPFIEGETYNLGGMNIGGNIPKVLKIKMSKEGYERTYDVNIGSNIYTTSAYVFNGLEFPSGGTGVYHIELWLDANGLESEHLSYNIICVSQADKFTAQLVSIGNPVEKVFNFADNKLFEYCVYNKGTATASPHIKISYLVNTNSTTIVDEELVNISTAAPLTYTASLEIEMEDESAALQLEALMTYGNEQVFVFPVDNSKSYPATTGAVFYMNPSARNNAQSNREKVINSITGAEIDAVFTRMAWTDGTDGWTTDDEGRKCLRLPAGCTMEMDYSPLSSVSQKTIELVYKAKNAADYDEPIFSICSDVNDPQFRGIVIRPKNILVHSRDLNVNDSLQDYNTTDEETLHVLITIIPNYKTNYGNLLQIYCNGDKVRSFSFETADRWDTPAKVKFGSMTADTYWYKFRDYNRGFETSDAAKNVTNAQPNTKAKEEMKARLEAPLDDSYNVSYDECVKNGLNTMVVEIIGQDQTVPSIANPSAKTCNTWIKINNPIDGELDADFARLFSGEIIEGETIEGQGTTAMTYARWNFRWKLSSKYNKRRITAKKNFASSMHSHKMGATRLFNDLNRAIVGPNDADSRVAVYQYPVYGFQKILVEGTTDQYLYEFIGLYTIGPDKGDKTTFGFDGEYESTLIHLEGTDHTPKGVGFDYPYGELGYSGSAEALGAVNATGAVVAAWECGAAGDYDPKDDPTDTKAMLDAEFRPAYDVAELNSTYILGVTETLEEMNANISAWQAKKDAEGRSYADLQFFTDGVYDLYFFNTRTQKYEARGINMLDDLHVGVSGLSLDEKTELFKAKRRERFVATWETYWHKNDSIFHYAFVLLFGATDNFKKNTYPYKYRPIAEGGVYRWRQDDLDTLFDINNQGLAAKIYSILVGDKTETGSGSIYRGDTSAFWTLIKECFPTEIKAMVHAILDKMVELSPYGNNTLEKLVGCVRYYFWDKAQAYFPASAYSKDAEWTYEDTWAAGLYKEVNPLQQSLGGHKEAEIDWVTMRMLFCAMYFNYGPFGAVNDSFSDTSTGQIAYGGAGAKTYLITMACDGNPTILRGQSELVTFGDRVKAGETIELTVPDSSGADTRIYIQGVDWMEDIGDLSDLQVSADNPQLSVTSKRLQSVKIGDEDASKVTTNVEALNFGACPSMMIVDARNAKSLTGTIDLSKMPRLMKAYFGGTGVKAVNVPNGSKIAVLELGEETTQISLMNLKFMELEGFRYSELPKLEFLRIENCSQLNPFTMLKSIYNTEGNVIRDIRIIGFDVDGDASDVTMIANLANDVDKDGNPHIYNGIDAEGKPMDNSHPIIEGRLRVNGNIYEEDYLALKAVFANLAMEFLGFYVAIKDPEVLRVLLEKITTDDGVGLTKEDIEKVTTISTWFKGNKEIVIFDEFEYFTGVKTIYSEWNNQAFGNSSLKYVTLPRGLEATSSTTGYGPFEGCTSLERVTFPTPIANMVGAVFNGCTSLTELRGWDMSVVETLGDAIFAGCTSLVIEDGNFPNLKGSVYRTFEKTRIKKISNLGEITAISNGIYQGGFCYNCKELTSVTLPPTIASIGSYAFVGCTALAEVIIKAEVPPTLDPGAFTSASSSFVIYVPNDSVAAYKEASNWVAFASRIYPMSVYESGELEQVVRFDDAEVQAVALANWDADGDGKLQEREILGVTSVARIFKGNANIKKFDDFYKLKNVTSLLGGWQNGAFYNCTGLTSITLPQSLSTMEGYVFQGCTSLNTVNGLENIVTMSGEGCFNGCPLAGMSEINMPNLTGSIYKRLFTSMTHPHRIENLGSITAIANTAYTDNVFGSGATFLRLPSTIQSISSYAFRNLTKVEKFVCEAITPPTVSNSFNETTAPIYVPDESVETYKTATNWTEYASRIYPMSVYENGGIENVITFADPAVEAICLANWDTDGNGYLMKNECAAVTSIAAKFQGNTEITSFNEFENFTGVSSIPAQAFYGCTALTDISLPNTITSIGGSAFNGCTALVFDDLYLPNVTSMGGDALKGVSVKRIVFGKNVQFAGQNGYGQFTPNLGRYDILEEVVLSDSQTAIANSAFANYTNIKKFTIPASVKSIGGNAFNGCSGLVSVIVNATTPPTLSSYAFPWHSYTIYVPDDSVQAYREATNWSDYASRIKPLSEFTE